MGQLRFLVSRPDRLPKSAIERIYSAAYEGIPLRSQIRQSDGTLVVDRDSDDSVAVFVPWRVAGHGELLLSTTSLMEREAPYHLEVELARGTLSRLRDQQAAWELAGAEVSDEFRAQRSVASASFCQAATCQTDPVQAADKAVEALTQTLDASELLVRDYTRQVLAARHQQTAKLPTLLACNMEEHALDDASAAALLSTFNAAVIPFSWRDIETNPGQREWTLHDKQVQWCRGHGLRVCSGPLLAFDPAHLPDWIYLWEGDFENLHSYVFKYVQAVARRYAGSVQVWHCSAATNVPGAMRLTEEQRLRLTVAAIDAVKASDPSAPVIVSCDQPWGEFMHNQDLDLSPLHFADALVRADLGLSGIALEINFGCWPGGSPPRDLLAFHELIERFASLGLPLLVLLTVPSASGPDPRARSKGKPVGDGDEAWTPERQEDRARRMVSLLLAKPAVHGIIWNELSDAKPHGYPHGGLLDAQDRPKPALASLTNIRHEHLT